MKITSERKTIRTRRGLLALATVHATFGATLASSADTLPNACPVDGCEVTIVAAKRAGEELEVTFDSDFTPDVAKNHFHVWWGENYTVEQVGRNAEPVHGVAQGRWHRHHYRNPDQW